MQVDAHRREQFPWTTFTRVYVQVWIIIRRVKTFLLYLYFQSFQIIDMNSASLSDALLRLTVIRLPCLIPRQSSRAMKGSLYFKFRISFMILTGSEWTAMIEFPHQVTFKMIVIVSKYFFTTYDPECKVAWQSIKPSSQWVFECTV